MRMNATFWAGTIVSLAVTMARPAAAAESDIIEPLRQQLRELDQKIQTLQRNQTLERTATTEKSMATPIVTAGPSGFGIASADSNFVAQVHGLIQLDSRAFLGAESTQGNDGLLLRRVRPIIQGTLFKDFDFLIVPELGGATPQIYDAFVNYRYRPSLQLRAGRFKVPVGLEQLQADPVNAFAERSLVTDLVPNRDLGLQLWGDIEGGLASYAIGLFNGVGDGRNSANADFEDHREVAGRLFLQPFKNSPHLPALQGMGFGAGASWGQTSSNATGLPNNNGYATDGQQTFFAYNPATGAVVADGAHWRLSPQLSYYYGPLSLMAEYAISEQEVRRTTTAPLATVTLRHTAYQVSAGWVLTGESASFNGVTPRQAFNPSSGQWGAWQVIARYSALNLDDDTFPLFANPLASAREARAFGVGLNWYLNRNLRISTSYSRTEFSGGGASPAATAPAAVTRQAEQAWFTRLQLSF